MDLQTLLKSSGQEHLASHAATLSQVSQNQLQQTLAQWDWDGMPALIDALVLHDGESPCYDDFGPASYYPFPAESAAQEQRYQQAAAIGEVAINAGKVAALTVAGGQGTRLGHDGPKGTYGVSPLRDKSLFQLFAESIRRESELAGRKLFWYIMTSPINDAPTRAFFVENDYFGLATEQITFFPQGTMPVFDLQGGMLLAGPDEPATSPDGHGGTLTALHRNGCLQHMENHGVELLSYFQVDNALTTIFDRTFVGLHLQDQAEMSSRCIMKDHPHDRLGNFGLIDDRLTVIEYSDLPDAMAQLREDDGRLTIRVGSPGIHLINRAFVERLTDRALQLPFHRAVKKVPFLDPETGEMVRPDAANAVKLEQFIFDAFPRAERYVLYQALKERELGPVKNKVGDDSRESAERLMIAEHARWLEAAGHEVPRNEAGEPLHRIEISPCSYVSEADLIANGPDSVTLGSDLYVE
ncbi:MAG TPA: 2-alkenal reductase [Lentisphaeria bacterium]|nr:2-alkenal reductase [Lentisphaeria bacterium]